MQPFPVGFAVVDVETTGLRPKTDRLVEIAVVRTDAHGNVLSELSTLVNPQRDPGATHIHGLTAAELVDAPTFGEILGELGRHLSGAVLVGHNLRFDRSFLREELARAAYVLPAAPELCTLTLAGDWLPGLGSYRLSACCQAIGIRHTAAHHALGDARAAYALLQCFRHCEAQRGSWPWAAELQRAGTIRWPQLAPSSRLLTRQASTARRASEETYLARLVASLPERTGGTSLRAYFAVLDEILEDRRVTSDEAQVIHEVAHALGLGGAAIASAHRAYLTGVLRAALADGVVTDVEREDLAKVMRLLGLHEDDLHPALTEARAGAGDPAMTPGAGRPLRAGMSVCFSGTKGMPKDELGHRARAAGLRVASRVSEKLDVLVVDDPCSMSEKAQQARSLRVRILAEPVFLSLVLRCEPAALEAVSSPGPTPRKSVERVPEALAELEGRRVLLLAPRTAAGTRLAGVLTAVGAVLAKKLTPSVDLVVVEDEAAEAERCLRARDLGCLVVPVGVLEALPMEFSTSPPPLAIEGMMAVASVPPATPPGETSGAETGVTEGAHHGPSVPVSGPRSRAEEVSQSHATAHAMPSSTPPAGWYADPWQMAPVRWWDGIRWTHHVTSPTKA